MRGYVVAAGWLMLVGGFVWPAPPAQEGRREEKPAAPFPAEQAAQFGQQIAGACEEIAAKYVRPVPPHKVPDCWAATQHENNIRLMY